MKIAVLSTEGIGFGGAVRATRRLVAGLRQRGHEAMLISLTPNQDPAGIGVEPLPVRTAFEQVAQAAGGYLQRNYLDARRTALSNTLFSAQVAGYSFTESTLLDDFEIFNIHWVTHFLAPHNVAAFLKTGKPVVLTLHDMATFTGGCHYSAGCKGYRETCTPCPQLRRDELNLTSWTLEQKRHLLRSDNLFAITPSRWLAECAAESGLFGPGCISAIPNSVETDLFRPAEKQAARVALGIDAGVKTLLFGAANNSEHRKGFDLLVDVLRRLKSDQRIDTLLAHQRLRLLVFGEGTPELRESGIPLLNLDSVRNDARLALIYSAADLLILSSREDNLPNIMLEAMACATPVVAFAVGGMPDTIEDRVDGRLIPACDVGAMASAVADLLHDEEIALAMGRAARAKMVAAYHLDGQASAYESLFETMLKRTHAAPSESRADRVEAQKTIALPITLHPGIASTPIALFLEQQALIDKSEEANARARFELDRVRDVLGTAVRDIVTSSSWRYTRRLRRGALDSAIAADATAEDAAVNILNLLRSKSWELTALLRLTARVLRRASRAVKPVAMVDEAEGTIEPHHSAAPFPASVVVLDQASLSRRERRKDTERTLNPICLHLYHLDLWDEFKSALQPIVDRQTPLYISLPETHERFISEIHKSIDERYCKVFVLENRGLDIYPFLSQFKFLIDQGIRPLTLTKLHTKKSTHHTRDFAAAWRQGLYQDLLTNHSVIVDQFRDGSLGMVCSRRWWAHETEDNPNSQEEWQVIEEVCKIFNVVPTYGYVTGSMYVVSFEYLRKLFHQIDLEKFLAQFELGYKASGTLAHGFERVVCYGLEKFAYKVGLI